MSGSQNSAVPPKKHDNNLTQIKAILSDDTSFIPNLFLGLFFSFNQSTPKMRKKARRTSMKKDRPERTGTNNVLAKRKDKLKDFNMSDL